MAVNQESKSVNEWCREIHAWAIEKGFWPEGEDRNKGEICALIHSEISELQEGMMRPAHLSDHVPALTLEEEELADIFIRVADCAEAWGTDLEMAMTVAWYQLHKEERNQMECVVCKLHSATSALLEIIRKPMEDEGKPSKMDMALGRIVVLVCDIARERKIDLPKAIEAKMAFNRTRPYKHGKKF